MADESIRHHIENHFNAELLSQQFDFEGSVLRLMPIGAWCKKVRSDSDYWQKVETYVEKQLDIRFTHGICLECLVQEKEKYRQLQDAQ